MRSILLLASCISLAMLSPAAGAQTTADELKSDYLGTHDLRLQWLDNTGSGNKGSAVITESNGKLNLEGRVEELYEGQTNYLKMDGSIKIISLKVFEFEGTIETRISFINDGKPNVRKGKFSFKVWGSRPYWRMQNDREQPDKGYMVTDYIDVFILKSDPKKAGNE